MFYDSSQKWEATWFLSILLVSACSAQVDEPKPEPTMVVVQSLEQQAFFDDFSDNLGNWSETGEGDWNTESLVSNRDYPSWGSGSPAAHSDNCDSSCTLTMATTVDLSTARSARLEFLRFVSSRLDRGEYLELQLWNGSSWVRVLYWTNNSGDDSRWHAETVDLSEYLGVIDFRIRFITLESLYNEHVHVDDVGISVEVEDTPICGDGVTNGYEQCDFADPEWAPICNTSCELTTYGQCQACSIEPQDCYPACDMTDEESCNNSGTVDKTCTPTCYSDTSTCPPVPAPWSRVCFFSRCFIECDNGTCPNDLICVHDQKTITADGETLTADLCAAINPY